MRRIKMLKTETGRHAGFGGNQQYHCRTGLSYDVPDDLAAAWVRLGIAKYEGAAKAQTAPSKKSTSKSSTD